PPRQRAHAWILSAAHQVLFHETRVRDHRASPRLTSKDVPAPAKPVFRRYAGPPHPFGPTQPARPFAQGSRSSRCRRLPARVARAREIPELSLYGRWWPERAAPPPSTREHRRETCPSASRPREQAPPDVAGRESHKCL